ncbi:MAG TPA: hypothetical protein DCG57_04780 [Candidatus Riflebacteria bacterium]|jgi:hypothetical protein|nr:MAG: hypothetical protein CVV41_22115 [Candidatus Riflebacteria bacterium HGW-Riflebacteria-1]HAE37941.1 hypothetical protein [Candidatus Riflebacteria bacterium]
MGIIIAYIALIYIVDTLIFWAFVEIARDKEFSEGIGIGESFVHCGISTLIGVGVKMTNTQFPIHLAYLFRPFNKAGLNFTSKILCLIIIGAAEAGITFVMAKSLAAALKSI